MRSVLFDHQGRVWDARSPGLAEHLGSSIAGKALVEYVVRNMGYVAVEGSERSVHVRVRPAIATPGSLGVLLCWLQDRQVERVLLSTFEKGWHHELMPSHHATTCLTAMATSRRAA